ncbi:phosphoglycerate kinase [Klebsormidium nitens]|uniref:Phosphoglycerate kinase n=1 Tax=Klebsormidium nitens TaxID=105231 RepID=A0A1Y1HS35_KLENI|nr:phosphoglycerate kinase [Klebsormidium nitens]|eukprot:GAQ79801.1 phosphoglycerate kinase [Klebsormidium nitens]
MASSVALRVSSAGAAFAAQTRSSARPTQASLATPFLGQRVNVPSAKAQKVKAQKAKTHKLAVFAKQVEVPSIESQGNAASSPQAATSTATDRKAGLNDVDKSEFKGKTVFVRSDLNVPLKDGKITDDTRIRASVPTLKYLSEAGARVVVSSHLGRPKDGPEDKFRLTPVAERLSELIGFKVEKANDSIGDEVQKQIKDLKDGGVLLLENVRFYKEEEKNDPEHAKALGKGIDYFVNDAFGTAHRAHASTAGIANYVTRSIAGFLLEKELAYLEGAVKAPKRPFVAIVGGSKVSSKIGVIESLIGSVDKIILGGGMIFTFYKSRGLAVGSSLVEEDKLELAKELTKMAEEKGVELILPTDVVVADKFAEDAENKTVKVEEIPEGWMGLDIGPDSIKAFQSALDGAKTVLWNGPMGVFEYEAFAKGTYGIAHTLKDLTAAGAITIIGGGDSVAAVEKAGLAQYMSHISTGGGASLELLEGKVLPGVAALDNVQVHA